MMENWTALKKGDLMMEIFLAEQQLNFEQENLWNKIKISPEIWSCDDVIQSNFWVVAKHEDHIIWYNDIEEGFNISKFKNEGKIMEYSSYKHDLNSALNLLRIK